MSAEDEAVSWTSVTQPDSSSFNPDAFNFYVHAPERTDPSCCPDGHDAITVLVPVPPLPHPRGQGRSEEDEQALVAQVRAAVFKRLAPVCGDVESSVVCESTRSPIAWRSEFGLFRGQVFGLAQSSSTTLPPSQGEGFVADRSFDASW
jgi:phytoene dehydrogenase-like protein